MANNKVVYNNTTLIDLTGDDVTAADVRSGVYFHTADGVQRQGTLVMADYVTEQGTSGNWTYRIWSSGIKECWMKKTASYSINNSSATYGGYRSGELNMDAFPFTYTNIPTVVATMQSGQGAWLNQVIPTKTGGTFYLSAGGSLSAANRTINFYVIGV